MSIWPGSKIFSTSPMVNVNIEAFSSVILLISWKDILLNAGSRCLMRIQFNNVVCTALLHYLVYLFWCVNLLFCIRNYDPHSQEQSSFSILFNTHHQWGKYTNVSTTKPSSVWKAITSLHPLFKSPIMSTSSLISNVESSKSLKCFLLTTRQFSQHKTSYSLVHHTTHP